MDLDFYRIQEAYAGGSNQTNYGSYGAQSAGHGQSFNKPIPGSAEKTNITPDIGGPNTGETVEMPDTEDHVKIDFFKKRMISKLNEAIDSIVSGNDVHSATTKLNQLKDYIRSFSLSPVESKAKEHPYDLPNPNRPQALS